MVEPRRGQIWWVDFGPAHGSAPAFRRPALIVQSNAFNRSRIATVIVAPITSTLRLGAAPANVALPKARSGLPRDSVVNTSQVTALDRRDLLEHHGDLPADLMAAVDAGLRSIFGL